MFVNLKPMAVVALFAFGVQSNASPGDVYKPTRDQFDSTTWEGVVVDESGKPVAGASVNSELYLKLSTVATDAKGAFKITTPPRSIDYHHLVASAEGGARMSDTAALKDLVGKNIVLTLKPARGVNVVVKDSQGMPIPDAWIQACCRDAHTLPPQKSGKDGTGRLWVPKSDPPFHVIAYKDGLGLDYKTFDVGDFRSRKVMRPKQPGSETIPLTLNGARTVTVSVRDPEGKPLAGVSARTWFFTKKGRGDDSLNVAGMLGFNQTTDADGKAQFLAIPSDEQSGVDIWIESKTHLATRRTTWKPNASDDLQVVMEPKVELSGTVLNAEGKPAANAFVQINSQATDTFAETARAAVQADDQGRFQYLGGRNQYYAFAASKGESASPLISRVVTKESIRDLELRLAPATRVFGHASVSGAKPDSRQSVTFSLEAKHYNNLPAEQQTLGPKKWNYTPYLSFEGDIDKEGNYELWLGPGTYHANAGRYLADQVIVTINGERELRQDLRSINREESIRLDGRVVNANNPMQGASGTSVRFCGTTDFRSVRGTPVTLEDGSFFMERIVGDGILEARTPDGKLAGQARIKGREKSVLIKAGPTATIKGRLVDGEGKPIADREVTYTSLENTHIYGGHFSGRTKTNAKGEFEFPGLVVDCKYYLSGATKSNERGEAIQWEILPTITPVLPGVFEAGDLRLK